MLRRRQLQRELPKGSLELALLPLHLDKPRFLDLEMLDRLVEGLHRLSEFALDLFWGVEVVMVRWGREAEERSRKVMHKREGNERGREGEREEEERKRTNFADK